MIIITFIWIGLLLPIAIIFRIIAIILYEKSQLVNPATQLTAVLAFPFVVIIFLLVYVALLGRINKKKLSEFFHSYAFLMFGLK